METEKQSFKTKAGQAFTLIELLVVIAIIAILGSLSLPPISRTEVSTRSIACKSNLRQIGLALSLYVDEFEFYPLYADATPHPDDHQIRVWDKALLPYC